MNLSELIFPLVFIGFIAFMLFLPSIMMESELQPLNCKQIEYKQRARLQVLTVCKDTLYDTGTGHQYETFKDSIKTIRGQL